MNRSYWSFCTRDDIRCSFNHGRKDGNGKKPDVPEKFLDAFEDLLRHINFLLPRVPVTIVWHWHLPRFDLTREDQEYKVFADLPSDLTFRYSSLTALRTYFRPWIGSERMPTFDIPGLEFFAITGKDNQLGMAKPGGNMVPSDHTDWHPTHSSHAGNSKPMH